MWPTSQIFGRTILAGHDPNEYALTYDDGPNDACTEQLLDLLARHNVRATFFLIGRFVRERGEPHPPHPLGRSPHRQPHSYAPRAFVSVAIARPRRTRLHERRDRRRHRREGQLLPPAPRSPPSRCPQSRPRPRPHARPLERNGLRLEARHSIPQSSSPISTRESAATEAVATDRTCFSTTVARPRSARTERRASKQPPHYSPARKANKSASSQSTPGTRLGTPARITTRNRNNRVPPQLYFLFSPRNLVPGSVSSA